MVVWENVLLGYLLLNHYILQSHIHDNRAYRILKTAIEDLEVENGCEFLGKKMKMLSVGAELEWACERSIN